MDAGSTTSITGIFGAILGNGDLGVDFGWIEPYAAPILSQIQNGENPFPIFSQALHRVFYPIVSSTFVGQIWFLVALFSLSLVLILLGLLLRLAQGRFWLVHRIDSYVTIPNISIFYSFWALVYGALSIVQLVSTIKVVRGDPYPAYYIGLQGGLPLILFLGQYSEVWATFAAFSIRRFGTHHHESYFRALLWSLFPLLFPAVAIVPSIILFVLACRDFNEAFGYGMNISTILKESSAAWVPNDGAQLLSMLKIIPDLQLLIPVTLRYTHWASRAFIYVGVILSLTLLVYIIGSYVEVTHLQSQARRLRQQAGPATPRTPMRSRLSNSIGKLSGTSSTSGSSTVRPEDEATSSLERQAMLLEWARTNRLLTAVLISLMLLVNAGLSIWFATSPISVKKSSVQFQSIVLVSGWVNSILSTMVALLILFRSLDGSNAAAKKLMKVLPWLPLPPSVGLRGLSEVTTHTQTHTVAYKQQQQTMSYVGKEGEGLGLSSHVTIPKSSHQPTPPWDADCRPVLVLTPPPRDIESGLGMDNFVDTLGLPTTNEKAQSEMRRSERGLSVTASEIISLQGL